MPLEARLDTLHAALRQSPLVRALAVVSRGLLALAFLPSGWKKLVGERFTQLPVTHPVGHFFDALYVTGPYYRFIGLCQVLAAVLLLIPRTATLGACLFLPIVANVVVLTVSLHFTGTVFVTVPMLLACFGLVLVDYDRWKPLLAPTFGWGPYRPAPLSPADAPARAAAGVLAVGAGLAVAAGVLLVLTEPQRATTTPLGTAEMFVHALAPVAAWGLWLIRGRVAIAERAAWTSAALVGLALLAVLPWTVVQPEASVVGVWTAPPFVAWALVAVGIAITGPARSAASAESVTP